MKPFKNIKNQLIEQEIKFDLLQSDYDPSAKSQLSILIKQWQQKFINGKEAPYLNYYLWHIFSYRVTDAFEGADAAKELWTQSPADTYIFNEPRQYLIKCYEKIPVLTMDDFFDDVYLCHHNMKWTYVLPHELPELGPYFSYG